MAEGREVKSSTVARKSKDLGDETEASAAGPRRS